MKQRSATKIKHILNWFIPKHILEQKELRRKAKILVYVHYFLLIIATLLILTCLFVEPANPLPIIVIFVGCIGSLYAFKKWGNFSLSGNTLALIPALGLVQEVLKTGGIYSDNLLWLYICPLLAFLFAEKKWGVMWSFLIMGYHSYLLMLELNTSVSFQEQLTDDPYYFFVSYTGLFLFILGVIYIFKSGQDAYIKTLRNQRGTLMQQKKEIELQTEVLRAQEHKLKKMNTDLEQFAYVVSHDLKEPLRTIGTYTMLIEQELQKSQNKKTEEYTCFVQDGVKRLQKMISNVLDDITNEKKDKKLIDLNDVMPVVLNNLSSVIREKNASVSYEGLPKVMGYSTAYIQLFQNLISNSIKFQKEHTLPKIQVSASSINGSHCITIKDNGIGIPEESLPHIFNIGERAGINGAYKGHGIGLSTCKKIVNRFNGNILVDSEVGRGTMFTIKLPRVV